MDNLLIRHNTERERFELLEADRVIGKAAYKDYDGGADAGSGSEAAAATQRIFYHTVINEEYGGQGLAGKLATEALDQTVAAGLRIVPVCPFIKKFLLKHTEYEAHVTRPTPAHLAFLEDALAQRVKA
ncbi:GNAT family N-acetyltransferase [Arthrobacter celericrescens]|uniref:GNAT family N-acetyltransferase n=1 Tax=Arthrobacter celericrescens TaxID=2320851 RepID=UPI000EA23E23|nr:GNAT family N-acetyltransferase [Arthrobacter celericrescens]